MRGAFSRRRASSVVGNLAAFVGSSPSLTNVPSEMYREFFLKKITKRIYCDPNTKSLMIYMRVFSRHNQVRSSIRVPLFLLNDCRPLNPRSRDDPRPRHRSSLEKAQGLIQCQLIVSSFFSALRRNLSFVIKTKPSQC